MGILFSRKSDLLMIIYVLLLGKWYINKKKTKDEPIIFQAFLVQLKSKVMVFQDPYSANDRNNRFNESYKELFNMVIYGNGYHFIINLL